MNKEIMERILQKIQQYPRIFIFRHIRNDGDCVGASKGLKAIIQLTWPEKEVYLIDKDTSAYLAFLGPEDEPVDEALYADALGIVVDTASESRISNKNYKLCKELVKIDHHIPLENYGDYIWVEEERSSCCEMIVAFYAAFKDRLKMDSQAWSLTPAGSAMTVSAVKPCAAPVCCWMWAWIRRISLPGCIWKPLNI